MKQLYLTAAALCLTACETTTEVETEPTPVVLPEPAQLVHYQDRGFAFCAKDCPAATDKMVLMSLDLSSADPRERVLARLRAQMLRQTGRTATDPGAAVVEVARSGAGDPTGDAWTVYALVGEASDPRTKMHLRKVLEAAPGARLHLLASEKGQSEAEAFKNALQEIRPGADIGTFVLTAPVRSDLTVASEASAAGPRQQASTRRQNSQLLVIRELNRN